MDENRTHTTPSEAEAPEAYALPGTPEGGPPSAPSPAAGAQTPPAGKGEDAPAVPGPVEEARPREDPAGEDGEGDASAGPDQGDAAAGEAEPPPGPDFARAVSIAESLLLVSTHPLSLDRIGAIAGGLSRAEAREVVRRLRERYPADAAGIVVEEVAKGLQFRTNPANQDYVRRLFDARPPRFSRAALETLAIVSYRQPVTRLEIEQVRGVDCAASLRTLMERRLVKVVGKKDVPGKPFLFGTTREFLEIFGLGSLADLPSLRDIEDFLTESRARAAAEAESEQEILPFDDALSAETGDTLPPPETGETPAGGDAGDLPRDPEGQASAGAGHARGPGGGTPDPE